MRSFPLVAALFIAAATPALAAQDITITYAPPDADGFIYPTALFNWPDEGQRSDVTVSFHGLDLEYANFYGETTLFKTWWTEPFGLDGNEYLVTFDCGDWNGCLKPRGPTALEGRLETPQGFSQPCNEGTLGDCSAHYRIDYGAFDGAFRVLDENDYGLTITFAESISAPEPATWAIMLGGIAGLGGMLRGRRAALRRSPAV